MSRVHKIITEQYNTIQAAMRTPYTVTSFPSRDSVIQGFLHTLKHVDGCIMGRIN